MHSKTAVAAQSRITMNVVLLISIINRLSLNPLVLYRCRRKYRFNEKKVIAIMGRMSILSIQILFLFFRLSSSALSDAVSTKLVLEPSVHMVPVIAFFLDCSTHQVLLQEGKIRDAVIGLFRNEPDTTKLEDICDEKVL